MYYAWEDEIPGDEEEPAPLDRIDNVGCINVEGLLENFPSYWLAAELRGILKEGKIGFTKSKCKREDWSMTVHRKYKGHIDNLLEWGVLRRLESWEIRSTKVVSGYFAVAKKPQKDSEGMERPISRSIFNGRPLNRRLSCRFPPVNLMPFREMCAKINKCRSFFHLDLRHFFHQLRAGQPLQQYFRIRQGGAYYEWVPLPMGFAGSPFIAQCVSYMICCAGENSPWKLDKNAGVPFFISLEGDPAVGFLTITYDNILVCCRDADQLFSVAKTLQNNMKKFGCVVKPDSVELLTEMMITRGRPHARSFVHLGVEFMKTEVTRKKDGRVLNEKMLCWRIEESKIKQWTEWWNNKRGQDWTLKELAQCCGRVFRHQYVAGLPLLAVPHAVKVLQQVAGTSKGARRGEKVWTKKLWLQKDVFLGLTREMEEVLSNQWVISKPTDRGEYVFTDASSVGWGVVVASGDGKLLKEQRGDFDQDWIEENIFLKEFHAVERGVQLVYESERVSGTLYVFCIYNVACQHCLRRGTSTSPRAREILEHMYANQLKEMVIEVQRIPSERNPADEPSRSRAVDEGKVARAVSFMQSGKTDPRRPEGLEEKDWSEEGELTPEELEEALLREFCH